MSTEQPKNFERPKPRVIGDVSLERKKEVAREFLASFGDEHFSQLPKEKLKELSEKELEKKSFEREAIRLANDVVNQLREKYGLEPFQIPARNVHILDSEEEFQGGQNGFVVVIPQIVVINAQLRTEPLIESDTILHEMLHMGGYFTIDATDRDKKGYRIGLSVDNPYAKASRKKDMLLRLPVLIRICHKNGKSGSHRRWKSEG